jgi:hypothetical protein
MNPFIFFVGVAALLVAAGLLSWLSERKRTQDLKALAASLKFSFSATDGAVPGAVGLFHLFSQGRSQNVTNIMRGSANDIDVSIMDYRYTTGSGRNAHTWKQTVIVFQSPLLNLPSFALRPENLFYKIGAVFGCQDIDFPSHPAFSRRYLLQGEDENAVRALFSNSLLSHYDRSKGMSTEGAGDGFIFYRASKRVPARRIRGFLQEGFALFSLMKTGA